MRAGNADGCDKTSPGAGEIIAYVKDSSSNGTFVASPNSGQEAERLEKGKPYGVRAAQQIIAGRTWRTPSP